MSYLRLSLNVDPATAVFVGPIHTPVRQQRIIAEALLSVDKFNRKQDLKPGKGFSLVTEEVLEADGEILGYDDLDKVAAEVAAMADRRYRLDYAELH